MKKLIIMVASLALVASFAMTAAAADWDFYGSARVNTAWTSSEGANTDDVDDFNLGLQGNSRIGANVKVSDELAGRFEFGVSDSTVNTRLIYGVWNFGKGSLTVGQAYTPLQHLISNQIYGGDNDMVGWGGTYSGRQAQIKVTYGGFQVAFINSENNDLGGYTTENSIPAIEAQYQYKFDSGSVALAGGYDTYELRDGSSTDVDAYVVALKGIYNIGSFYFKGTAFTGTNAGQLIYIDVDGSGTSGKGSYDLVTQDVIDDDTTGYALVAGMKLNDMFSFELGYGYAEVEPDNAADDSVKTYYAQTTINLAPGVFVVPEIGKVDYDNDAQLLDETTYAAIKWQINF